MRRECSECCEKYVAQIVYLLPAPPKPATARPKIKKFTLGATPHKRDPISNQNTDAKLRKVNDADKDIAKTKTH